MPETEHHQTEHHHPRPADQWVFAVKSSLLKFRRGVRDLRSGGYRLGRVAVAERVMLAEIATPLYIDGRPNERGLQLGKVQNLRVGAKALDGVQIRAGQVFSFWAQVGRPTRAKGFVEGRELRQGCLIPTLAGGLCQLSNSLFQAAKRSGCEIVERHGHSAPIPDSPFPQGEDATVFWNYVDLRFRPSRDVVLRVFLTADTIVVRVEAAT